MKLSSIRPVYILLFSVILFLAVQIPFIDKISKVWVDEPWYAGTAYNFSTGNGLVNDNVVGKFGGDETFLYTLFLGITYKLFGCSLLVSRLFSVFFGIITLIAVYILFKKLKFGVKSFFVFSLLLIFSSTSYVVFRTVRPEAFRLPLIIFSLLALFLAFEKNDHYYILSGFLIFCAALCHPNELFYGLIFGIISLIVSLKKKTMKPVAYYSAGSLIVFLIFIFYIYTVKGSNFKELFFYWGDRTTVDDGNLILSVFARFIRFSNEYSFGIKRAYVFLFELGVLILGLTYIKKNRSIFIVSAIGLSYFVMSMIFLARLETRGFISVIIFSLIAISMIAGTESGRKSVSVFLIIAISLYIMNNSQAILYVWVKNRNLTHYSYIEKELNSKIPKGSVVLSHLNFYFPLKDTKFYNDYTYYFLTKYNTIDSLLKSDDVEYIAISDYMTKGVISLSGRNEKKEVFNDFVRFYLNVKNYADSNFTLYDSVVTEGYGTIYLYGR